MRTFSFFDPSTGAFHQRKFRCSVPKGRLAAVVEANTPEGYEAIEGDYDDLSQRMEVATRTVVDYQPPRPDADHEWNVRARRWVKSQAAHEKEARRVNALAEITQLEQRQARRVRELLAEKDPQLKQFDERIAELRRDLT